MIYIPYELRQKMNKYFKKHKTDALKKLFAEMIISEMIKKGIGNINKKEDVEK